MKARTNLNAQTLHLLQQTSEYFNSHGQRAYLVGGSLRNLLMEEACSDWDIVVCGEAPWLARRLADELGGYYAHLHERASRVVVPLLEGQEFIVDVSPLKGGGIEDDLGQRDFTINAMAAPLDEVVRCMETGEVMRVIDPLNGRVDIEARCLRAVDGEVFRHDPLRLLRGVRLAARYWLEVEGGTEGLMVRDASLLLQAAPERMREELYAILAVRGATEHLHLLDACGLLTILMPEFIPAQGMLQPSPHYWDVLEHSLQSVGKLELLAGIFSQAPEEIEQSPLETGETCNLREIAQLLREAEQQGIFQRSLLMEPRVKLAALLHDIGKPATYTTGEDGAIHFYGHPQASVPLVQEVMQRLSASTADRRLVQQFTAHHMRPGQFAIAGTATPRAIRRYFVDLGPNGITIALFSLADHLATRGPLLDAPAGQNEVAAAAWRQHVSVICLLLTQYIRKRESILPPRLVSGEELMRRLHLEPGPKVGLLLEHLAEAQAEGRIHSKEEALWLAEEKLLGMES